MVRFYSIILLISIIGFLFIVKQFAYSETRISCGVDISKGVNWVGGLELYCKGTTSLHDSIDFKYGVSQYYDSLREAPYSYNHGGYRVDIGFLVYLPMDFKFGYTHSQRSTFDENNKESLYNGNSVDTLSVRKEIKF